MVRVIRNNQPRRLFTNLLAKGDIIELALGEQAPADARLIVDTTDLAVDTTNDSPLIIKRRSRFLPTNDMITDPTRTHYAFELLDTPFAQTLHDMLASERPKSSFENELRRLRLLWQRATCIVFALTIVVVTLRFILLDIVQLNRHDRVFEAYIQVVYVLMPMLPSGIVTLIHVCRICATARLITLFELLQASKSAFEESEEVDEFDQEAPPPTKEVHVKLGKRHGYTNDAICVN
jgi:magnesium-transporting ATPase (P-type)